MPITIGKAAESGYTNPLGLLSDCHRRIERFLNLLVTVLYRAAGEKLHADEREALETALRYFREAAPKHTNDEEESLFPRLRAQQNPLAQAAFSILDILQDEHEIADMTHREIETLCLQWLAADALTKESCHRLGELLARLKTIYDRHIAVEDTQIFPLAQKLLDGSELHAIAQEMALRRGIDLQARGEFSNFS